MFTTSCVGDVCAGQESVRLNHHLHNARKRAQGRSVATQLSNQQPRKLYALSIRCTMHSSANCALLHSTQHTAATALYTAPLSCTSLQDRLTWNS